MRRLALCVLFVMCVAVAQGQGNVLEDTKPDPVSKPMSGGVDMTGVLQMLGAVMLVGIGVKWALPKWLNRVPKQAVRDGGHLMILETISANGVSFHLIEVEGSRLLVAGGPNGVTLIADLHEKPKAKAFGDLIREAQEDGVTLRNRIATASSRLDSLL